MNRLCVVTEGSYGPVIGLRLGQGFTRCAEHVRDLLGVKGSRVQISPARRLFFLSETFGPL
jgi:hypothetical protein